MTYKLYVGSMVENSLWKNYVKSEGGDSDLAHERNNEAMHQLHKYNATDIPHSLDLSFDTEEDAVAFKLKFG